MKLLILGKGGTGRELACLLRQENHDVNFLDDVQTGADIVGTCFDYEKHLDGDSKLCSALGSYRKMSTRTEFLEKINLNLFFDYQHSSSVVYLSAKIGAAAVIYPGAVVTSDAKVGKHVLLYHNTIVSHDSEIGDFSIVSNGSVVSGNVKVGKQCYLGAGCVVLENITIGDNCVIAAGSTVVKDVPPNSIYINTKNIKSI